MGWGWKREKHFFCAYFIFYFQLVDMWTWPLHCLLRSDVPVQCLSLRRNSDGPCCYAGSVPNSGHAQYFWQCRNPAEQACRVCDRRLCCIIESLNLPTFWSTFNFLPPCLTNVFLNTYWFHYNSLAMCKECWLPSKVESYLSHYFQQFKKIIQCSKKKSVVWYQRCLYIFCTSLHSPSDLWISMLCEIYSSI